jgi:hypothetical protein
MGGTDPREGKLSPGKLSGPATQRPPVGTVHPGPISPGRPITPGWGARNYH